MAKTDPGGRYVGRIVHSFEDVSNELLQIAAAMQLGRAGFVEFLHVEPEKVFEGLVVGADGTDWNPGAGQGIYAYYNSTWNKL